MPGRNRKSLRRCAALVMIMMMLAVSSAVFAEDTFFTQLSLVWANVKDTPVPSENEKPAFRLLRRVMEGYFNTEFKDALGIRIMAASLPLLAQVQEDEISAFAGIYRLSPGLVEQGYMMSLTETLRASVSLGQPTGNSQGPYQSIMNDWLNGTISPAGNHEKPADEGTLQNIAQAYNLPLRFIRFLSTGIALESSGADSQPTQTTQVQQGTRTPAPAATNEQAVIQASPNPEPGGAEQGNQTPGTQDNGTGSPEKRR